MKKIICVFLLTIVIFSCNTNEDINLGTPTTITGSVKDIYNNEKVSNYKIVLKKTYYCGGGWSFGGDGICSEEILEIESDLNGYFEFEFNYLIEDPENERYFISSNYINYPYNVHNQTGEIQRGEINKIDIEVWKPIKVTLNLTLKNNHSPPLISEIRQDNGNKSISEFTYSKDTTREIGLFIEPQQESSLIFRYNEDYSNGGLHQMIGLEFKSSLNDTTIYSTVDCNTF
ncbi:hypothetical protein QYS49_35310 [Marivirga salinae]|uniref:Lipoprotein n=1 Tax=Marivirga salinarum TaxID=3059078 RepID=A0AA51NCS0_9BACT|nr:hypothetical protein [Marivirga sp. BDSF4-3]WMN13011.1 hypothetical protein QYS49_35310 [Marivirga sp. BDSF4-3]